MEHFRLDKAKFSRETSINYTTIDSVVNEKTNNKPSFDTLYALMLRYRQVNPDWLIFGEGEMFRKTDNGFTDYQNLQKSVIDETKEDSPKYKHEKPPLVEKTELEEKRWELAMIEIEALRRRVELLEKEAKRKK